MLNLNNKYLTVLVSILFISVLGVLVFKDRSDDGEFNTYYVQVSSVYGVKKLQPVNMGGYAVGFVEELVLDDKYQAMLVIKVRNDIKIAKDSMLSLNSSSLISSDKNINIVSGVEFDYLENQDTISNSFVGLDFNKFLAIIYSYVKGTKK